MVTISHRKITEIIRPIDSGMTEPFLCAADDDCSYCVKGRRTLARGKIAEVIAATAGIHIGLPIPDFCISVFSDGLLKYASEIPEILSIGTDPAFSSKWVEPVDYFSVGMQSSYSKRLLAKLFLFDQWIKNGDRTLTELGGNVNLLVGLADKNLIVIDHNLAFSESFAQDDASLHVGYPAWASLEGRQAFALEVQREMSEAFEELRQIEDHLPVEWLEQEPDFVDKALTALSRAGTAEFWNDLL